MAPKKDAKGGGASKDKAGKGAKSAADAADKGESSEEHHLNQSAIMNNKCLL